MKYLKLMKIIMSIKENKILIIDEYNTYYEINIFMNKISKNIFIIVVKYNKLNS